MLSSCGLVTDFKASFKEVKYHNHIHDSLTEILVDVWMEKTMENRDFIYDNKSKSADVRALMDETERIVRLKYPK